MKVNKKHNILKQKRYIEKRIILDKPNKINNKTTKIEITNKDYNFNKKIVIFFFLILVIVFIVTVASSYAFFTTSIKGKEFVIYTGNLEIDYEKKTDVIGVNNAYPMSDTEGLQQIAHEFKVTNNGNINARYQIRLELDETVKDMIDIRYIKIAYQVNGGEYSKPVLLSDLNSSLVFTKNAIVSPNESNTYGMKLWIDLGAPNDIQGKIFKARVVVDSIQNVEDGYVVDTTPIIYLNKDTNGNQDIYLKTNEIYTELGVEKVEDDQEIFTPSQVSLSYEYYDGNNLSTVQSIDTSKNGIYYVTYSITDKSGNTGSRVRIVTVNPSNTIPTITLNGNEEILIPSDVYYTDPGVIVDNNNSVITLGEVKTSAPGSYIIRYIVVDKNGNLNSVTRTVNVSSNLEKIFVFDYVEDENGNGYEQEFIAPYNGQYQIETWGAQGGSGFANSNYEFIGGYGGYSSGSISLEKNKILYINVGGNGMETVDYTNVVIGGYNGGGPAMSCGGLYSCSSDLLEVNNYIGSGGGATHIASESGLLYLFSNKISSVYIVSGGGGGNSGSNVGGHAGGYIGGNGNGDSSFATGGTQNYGGKDRNGYDGDFGVGSLWKEYTFNKIPFTGSGGGAGFYGGGRGFYNASSAGGGSSYIGNSSLTNKIMYCYDCEENDGIENPSYKTISTTGSNADTTNCPDGYSESPISKCAKAGNGYARITYLGY